MKRILLITTLFLLTFTVNAQRGPGNPKIKAFKIAFITEKLNLNETEAEKFWPIYNKFEDTNLSLIHKEKKEIRKKVKDSGGLENISNKEAEVYLAKLQEVRKALYENKIQFHNSLIEFLPAKKILLLEIAEHEFNRRLMERLKNRRMERRK